MFGSLKYFSDCNLPIMGYSFHYIPNEILKQDFNNIDEKQLLIFCKENVGYLKNSLRNISEDELIEVLKKEFILKYVRERIPKMRLNSLLNSNKPYCDDDLKY